MRTNLLLRALLTAACAACARDNATPADTAASAAPSAAPSSNAASADSVAGPWVVSADGAGPLRAGMSAADARAATHDSLALPITLDANCDYARVKGAPGGLRVMIVGDRVARVDVDSAFVATTRGARVGDTEARVRALYGAAVREEPHKYVPGGHYLVVPGSDTTRALVFETDGKVVTRLRGGRLPEVRWIEGCG